MSVLGAKIPKFGGKGEHNFAHNGAGVRLPPPPRPVIKEFHRGNIFFLREKISGKYCPQSPIIGPFANLFSHGAVFAQSTRGGEEGGGVGGRDPENYLKLQMCWKKTDASWGGLLNGLLSVRLTLEAF